MEIVFNSSFCVCIMLSQLYFLFKKKICIQIRKIEPLSRLCFLFFRLEKKILILFVIFGIFNLHPLQFYKKKTFITSSFSLLGAFLKFDFIISSVYFPREIRRAKISGHLPLSYISRRFAL